MIDIQINELSKEQRKKCHNDLVLISLFSRIAKEKGFRVIISGGYAVDGALGMLTRPHNDIDIQIYGRSPDANAVITELFALLGQIDEQFKDYKIDDRGRSEFYHNFYITVGNTIADTYYLQTVDSPFDKDKKLVKKDNSSTLPHPFESKVTTLEDFTFEVQEPSIEIADKIFKREYRGDEKKHKHEQDIYNLKLITTEPVIQNQLKKLIHLNNKSTSLRLYERLLLHLKRSESNNKDLLDYLYNHKSLLIGPVSVSENDLVRTVGYEDNVLNKETETEFNNSIKNSTKNLLHINPEDIILLCEKYQDKYYIMDGNHTFEALKLLGLNNFNVIYAEDDIIYNLLSSK